MTDKERTDRRTTWYRFAQRRDALAFLGVEGALLDDQSPEWLEDLRAMVKANGADSGGTEQP